MLTTEIHVNGNQMPGDMEPLMTPGEVALAFRVHAHTVVRWADTGKLTSIRTPGNHRRFRESEVRALLSPDANGVQS